MTSDRERASAGVDPIFTIGHGDRSFGDMEQRLARHHVQTLVDVRSVPYSRYALEFVKDELEAIAAEAGLGYRWLGDRLGGRLDAPDPDDPRQAEPRPDEPRPDKPRPDEPSLDEPRPDETAREQRFRSGIDELLALARTSRVAVLCSELDHRHCHRSIQIAPVLEAAGHHVMHIDAAGDALVHQPSLDL